jgi:hypothetical protein
MNANTYALFAIAFVMGAGSALFGERLLTSSASNADSEQAVVKEAPAVKTPSKPNWPYLPTASLNNPIGSSLSETVADNSPQQKNIDSECDPSGQQVEITAWHNQETFYPDQSGELDSSLEDERYAFATDIEERERQRELQIEILASEEANSLHAPPPSDYEMSAEEQDALELETIDETMSASTPDEDTFLQQILEEENPDDLTFSQ